MTNLIITHKDGRTWNEGQLGEFLRETLSPIFGEHSIAGAGLGYGRNIEGGPTMWFIEYRVGIHPRAFTLDPSLYTVSPVGMVAVEKANNLFREMYEYAKEGKDLDAIQDRFRYMIGAIQPHLKKSDFWDAPVAEPKTIAVEKVRECIEEIKRIMPAGFLGVNVDSIASKYLGEEN